MLAPREQRTFLPVGGVIPFTVIKEMGKNTQKALVIPQESPQWITGAPEPC